MEVLDKLNLKDNFKGTYGTLYYVEDMKKALNYYKETFNFIPEEESAEWTTFNLNGHRICLHAVDNESQLMMKGLLILDVDNLKEVVVELKLRGVEFVKEITQVCEGGFSADFKDPNGHVISMYEYLA